MAKQTIPDRINCKVQLHKSNHKRETHRNDRIKKFVNP